MKLCIISDLHCKYCLNSEELTDTLLISNKPRIPANQHPIAALKQTIANEKLNVDIVICPGDLANRADEQGIISSFAFLNEIKLYISASYLYAIPGNHDINSRSLNGKDAMTFIKNFDSDFPFTESALNDSFWNRSFAIVNDKNFLLLAVNTVQDHITPENAKISTISTSTIAQIQDELKKIKCNELRVPKICILHHHPTKHSDITNYRDSDSLEKGDQLLDCLRSNNFSLTIHGHKHQPRLLIRDDLPILASGTFSSLANINSIGVPPMFHIVELQDSNKKGTINTWSYNLKEGWTQNLNPLFPPKIGFGSLINSENVAETINNLFEKNKRKSLLYDNVLDQIPDLNYTPPSKLIEIGEILRSKHKIAADPQYPLTPVALRQIIR